MDTVPREQKIPPSRLPITRDNVLLHAKPPAPGPKVHGPSSRRRTPPRSPPPQVTLTQPRSHSSRIQNEYSQTPHPPRITSINVSNINNLPPTSNTSVVLRQPESLKDNSSDGAEACAESIICANCKRCRCKSCATPKELPRKWMCGNTEVSLQCAVEKCTCLCVVEFLFDFLGINDREDDSPVSDPCALCDQPHCCKRWTCMGLLSLCLPCLCCYPFLKCGLNLCTKCYDRATRRGCTCRAKNVPGSRKLLIEHENSSST